MKLLESARRVPRGAALRPRPGAIGGRGGAAQGVAGAECSGLAWAFLGAARWPVGARRAGFWVMAGGAARREAELLALPRFRDSSAQSLAYGYGRRSVRELRECEFGRLKGEAGGAPVRGWLGCRRGARGCWSPRGGSFLLQGERRYLIRGAF